MNLKKTLPFFSYLFHPIFIPLFAAIYYFFGTDSYYSNSEKYLAIIQIVAITMVLPILLFFILKATKKVDSIMIADISQRKIPLLIMCFLTILLVQKYITLDRFPELHFFYLGGLISTFLALVLLFFNTKASLHLVAISTLTFFVIGLRIHHQTQNLNWTAFFVLMNGFVAASRLEMKAHTPKELVIGFVLGSIPQLFLFPYWL